MRAVLLILILLVVALIAAISTGLLDITQTRSARAPQIATDNGITASGGQAPAFDVETGSISVGASQQNVTVPVPRLDVNPANDASNAAGEAAPANPQADGS